MGLQAARGRVSLGPDAGDSFLSIDGVLTRTVADTAAALDVLAGYEPGDATWAPDPDRPYAQAVTDAPGHLRIGLATTPPLEGAELGPPCLQATLAPPELPPSLAHHVEGFEPPGPTAEGR